MKVFTCIDQQGHYPVGFAAVVVAPDKDEARKLLDMDIVNEGLIPGEYTLQEMSLDIPQARVLVNGDY